MPETILTCDDERIAACRLIRCCLRPAEGIEMLLIGKPSVDRAFAAGAVRRVLMTEGANGGWYLAIEAGRPAKLYGMRTRRGGLRIWRDADALLAFLKREYGIRCGGFVQEQNK